jgi:hypothetical protein
MHYFKKIVERVILKATFGFAPEAGRVGVSY